MSDFVVKFPVRPGKEAQLFGDYLAAFMERLAKETELWAADAEQPWLMIHSDPSREVEVKVVTFDRASAASDFATGWTQALRRLPAA